MYVLYHLLQPKAPICRKLPGTQVLLANPSNTQSNCSRSHCDCSDRLSGILVSGIPALGDQFITVPPLLACSTPELHYKTSEQVPK